MSENVPIFRVCILQYFFVIQASEIDEEGGVGPGKCGLIILAMFGLLTLNMSRQRIFSILPV